MTFLFSASDVGRRYSVIAAMGVAALTMCASSGGAASAQNWPAQVSANYKVHFNGFNIGKFSFLTRTDRSGSQATSSARLKAFFGAFRWKGTSQSKGRLSRSEPKPAAYSFTYRSKSKQGSLSMKFQGSKVASLRSVPPAGNSSKRVPVKPKHLQRVFDPLSAVIALTRAQPVKRGANPCQRRLPIFDGKQRFDLVFSYLRQTQIRESRPSGVPTTAYICRVRYVPIAGYKRKSKTTRYMANAKGIEVVLRPVPEAGILIPYKITVPTMIGSATLVSDRVNITTASRRQIAFVN